MNGVSITNSVTDDPVTDDPVTADLAKESAVIEDTNYALIVSRSTETVSSVEGMLATTGVPILVASNEKQAFAHLLNHKLSYILIESGVSEAPCKKFIRDLKINIGNQYIPIIILATIEDEDQLSYCMSAGCDDILFNPFTALALNSKIASLKKTSDLKKLYKASISEQIVARRILSNAIAERNIKFDEIELLNRSKDIFSGDLFLAARHPEGSINILLADFTGHGLPSSIGALPVADIFSAMSEKGFELDYILENINNKLLTLLPISMFMACSVLNISRDLKQLKVWNGGMPDIYIRDGETRKIKNIIQSSDIALGITETVLNQYKLKKIVIAPDDQLILFTDGLTEALNNEDDMFGEQRIEACLRNNTTDESIFSKVIDDFDEFCGGVVPDDDVTFACVSCTRELVNENNIDLSKNKHIPDSQDSNWHWYVELSGESLREINPVKKITDQIRKISGYSMSTEKLSNIMYLLYRNVIEICGCIESSQFVDIHKSRKTSGSDCNIFIKAGIKKIYHNGIPALLIYMEDNGKEYSQETLTASLKTMQDNDAHSHDEFPLVYELNKLSTKKDSGNRLEAIIFEYDRRVKNHG